MAKAPRVSPLVSVVTPVWNAAATLAETVASVRAQSFPDWEMLVVDDGSTDGSAGLIAALAAEEPRLRPIRRATNGGAAAARNEGIAAAAGRFVAFVDADDLWYPEKLERQVAHIEATGAGLVFSAYRRIDAAGRPLGRVGVPARIDRAGLLKGNVIGCLTAVYDRAVYGRVAMPPLRRRQDYGLWLELLARGGARGGTGAGLDEVLADYRVRAGSLSADRLAAAAATWRLYREAAGLGRARAAYYLAHNLARGLAKRAGG